MAIYSMNLISGAANSSDISAWQRKMVKITKLVEQINAKEDYITELRDKLQPVYDKLAAARADMVTECIHPADMLVYDHDSGVTTCKFCNRQFALLQS